MHFLSMLQQIDVSDPPTTVIGISWVMLVVSWYVIIRLYNEREEERKRVQSDREQERQLQYEMLQELNSTIEDVTEGLDQLTQQMDIRKDMNELKRTVKELKELNDAKRRSG